ncbi:MULTISPECIES: MHYT domain-containing protein [unclassified Nocardia]|uniref:MHYT domain-containing protein n=1 Tax=unclassified Nocardia TaxID=2637762 RepID=UPI001CE3C365|nr:MULTISPECIES: MHYT domain-containing protein [unclassified Nocardia]
MPDGSIRMLAESASFERFSMGYWLAALSFIVSVVGTVVGLACVLNGARSARFRIVWVVSAAVSLGGVGVWLTMAVALLGLKVPNGAIRYDAGKLITAMVVAVVAVLVGLALIGRTRRTPWLIAGGLVMGLGTGATIYLGVSSVRVQGSVNIALWLIGISVAVAVITALATLWSFQTYRNHFARGATTLLFGIGVAASYYVAIAAMDLHVDRTVPAPTGMALFDFVFPMFVVGSLGLAVPISAVLIAPGRDSGWGATATAN